MLHYKCCPVVLILVLGLVFGSCEQPGGASTEEGLNQTNDDDNTGSEFPEGWEDWEEEEEEPPVVIGIEIVSKPYKTIYPNNFAEPGKGGLNFEGLVVNRIWNNGTTTELKSRVALSEDYVPDPSGYTIDSSSVVPNTKYSVARRVVIKWGKYEADFNVLVDKSNRVLDTVIVGGSLPEFQYLNAAFNFGSLTITGKYTEGPDEKVPTSYCTVTGYDKRKRGPQTVTIRVNGALVGSGAYPVTVKVPASATVKPPELPSKYIPGQTFSYMPAYLKGQKFSLADAKLTVNVTLSGQIVPLAYGDGGFTDADLEDTDDVLDADSKFVKTGNQKLRLKLDDASAVDIPFYVLGDVDGVQPRVYFDYGYRQTETDKVGKGYGDGKYYLKSGTGASLVLAPVRYLIGYNADHTDGGASYTWTVTGGAYDTSVPHNGETFTLKPSGTASATYTVSVSVTGRNFITGVSDTKTAATEVVYYSGMMSSTKTFQGPLKDFAPGQFTERGTGYGWSLGAALGYEIWDATNGSSETSVTQARITGNAFSSWSEPGVVWVQSDDNGNGIPDETWYELQGSDDSNAHKASITRRFALTYIRDALSEAPPNQYGQIIRTIYWADQRGRVGILPGGWPSALGQTEKGIAAVDGTWITYTGTLLRDSKGIGLNSGGSSSGPGYVDAYNGDDIFRPGSAVNADGTSAGLTRFRFIKVQCAYFDYGTSVGEFSTEIVSGTGLTDQSGGFPLP
ncbi:MAG: hypothetical protein LBK61_06760 [Spirochaetaceae bacterium]|jgi:hypothetical protein|nr:hypothetical protein [Spirochaetaceae bacterium]